MLRVYGFNLGVHGVKFVLFVGGDCLNVNCVYKCLREAVD